MSKHNILDKKIKKQFISINDSIERYFNNLRQFILDLKKTKLSTNYKLFFGFAAILIIILSYFLIPTLYDKTLVQSEIKNQIQQKYNVEVKFNETIKYGLLPKPHFVAKNLLIIRDNREIAESKNAKMFISFENFFSINKPVLKNFIFKNTDFKIYKKDLIFFKDLLKTEPNENSIIFKNSNIFYKNSEDEILFINKIKESEFYYDANNLENVLVSKNEIFNLPFKLKIKNDKFNKEINSTFNSKKIRLNIENKIDYSKTDKFGILDILFVNKSTSLNYQIKKNSLSFNSENKKNSYKGNIEFKPFFLRSNFNYKGLSTKNLLNENLIFLNFVKSEILNSKNLNAELNLFIEDITNIDELNNLDLNINIDQGTIGFSGSNLMWKDACKISLNESFLSYDEDGINLIGKIVFDFIDINNLYKTFQIKKDDRKNIENVEIDFIYNFDLKKISFDNVKIENVPNNNLQKFLDKFNLKNDKVFNRITFKNFVSNFFSVYAG